MQRELEFEESDFKELTPTPNLNLPDIKAVKCLIPKDNSPYMLFICKSESRHTACLNCGSINIISNGVSEKPRIVRDVNIGLNRVDLLVEVPRYRCRDCGASFRQEYQSIPEKQQLTERLLAQIKHDAFFRPFSQVAEEYGYSEPNIRNIFNEYVAELDANRPPIEAPEVLGIDEKHINKKMRGVFVDIIGGKLLDITENNKEDFISRTVMNMCHYENIRVVTMDMANGYKSKVQDILPNATIVVDKYHVFQDLHRQIATVKKAIMPVIRDRLEKETDPQKALNMQKAYNIAACNTYLFKFGKKKLVETETRLPALAEVCDVFPEFNHLRLIKEGFERIYEESVTREDAEALYKEWVKLIPPVGTNKINKWEQTYGVSAELFAAMRTFLHTTKNWHEEIFNYFNPGCNYTNATTEGINSLLQRINSMGSGYGFASLRAHALYQNIVGGRYKYSLSKTFASKSVKDLSGYQYTYCTPLHLFDERTVTSINVTMEIENTNLCDEVDPDWFIFYD